jgi:hypothetical protein
MFSFTENSLNHITQTIAEQRQNLEKIIADRPATQRGEENITYDGDGEKDFTDLPKGGIPQLSLKELLR